VVVDDLEDLDEAEGGSQPAQGRLLVGVDLAFAVVLAASLEGQDLQVARQVLELGQQLEPSSHSP
jgi:hypothetical protein